MWQKKVADRLKLNPQPGKGLTSMPLIKSVGDLTNCTNLAHTHHIHTQWGRSNRYQLEVGQVVYRDFESVFVLEMSKCFSVTND